jgi:hypothetical protein
MKVSVTLSLDVDPAAWDLAYGTGTEAKAVREDVRQYVLNQLQGIAPVDEGGVRSVELRTRPA